MHIRSLPLLLVLAAVAPVAAQAPTPAVSRVITLYVGPVPVADGEAFTLHAGEVPLTESRPSTAHFGPNALQPDPRQFTSHFGPIAGNHFGRECSIFRGCTADWNQNAEVSVQDIFEFLEDWFAGDRNADMNGSGVLSVQDIFDFLRDWFTGC